MDKHCQTDDVTLQPWPLTFQVNAHADDAGHPRPSVYQALSLKFEIRGPSPSEDVADFPSRR